MRLALLSLLFFIPVFATAQSAAWKISKPQWSTGDEARFGEFVARLGEAVSQRQCLKVDTCLRSAANIYAGSDPKSLRHFADCADLPYYLRSYFAWKNALPMSFQSSVNPRQSGDRADVRYTRYGNRVGSRYDIISTSSSYPNAVNLLNGTIIDSTWSASYRMMGQEDTGLYTDFYPVQLGREAVRPGTVIYDPNGHVAIIYKVSDDGRIFYIDSHPDNTLTSGMYTPKFVRSLPQQGAGFKNFRPLALVGAQRFANGDYYGGRIVGARNSQLPMYSLEQFYGNRPDPNGDWQKGQFVYRGTPVGYYDYLRLVMARGDLKIDPLKDMKQTMADICTSLRDRVVAVDTAIQAGIHQKPHPYRLPRNIYGAEGEVYASPSRDARLKVSFMDLLAQARNLIARYRAGDPGIVYAGENLAADLLTVYELEARACVFAYKTSIGQSVSLNIDEARRRVFAMSFDPYHCPELRWGANSTQELASCRDSANKREWYSRERWLRYQWERRYDARMDYSLEELTGPKPGAGIAQPPDVDIVGFLNSMK